ncbi:MAG: nucleotidyl transferase AbiEii/AbiGii toxin family protein [Eubacterium sp.]|nr:nucleotidyl transferase AbiEii/AbiGii toxin family protein [Eubacterium sp.]
MKLTPEQIKGRIKNVAKQNHADARSLMRLYMMERFLERIACSEYRDNFIIKGGVLVTAMVGVAFRSTMDIDTTVRDHNLSHEDAKRIFEEIKNIDLNDGITFEIKESTTIMDEMEYPGVRFMINAKMEKLITPMKIDISTGDVITPQAIEYQYKLLLEDRSIQLWTYNLETILAEKLQTVLARGILNTRMRDFYDIRTLLMIYEKEIKEDILTQAFKATCSKRGTEKLKDESPTIVTAIETDQRMRTLWELYRKKFLYAAGISYSEAIESLKMLLNKIVSEQTDELGK